MTAAGRTLGRGGILCMQPLPLLASRVGLATLLTMSLLWRDSEKEALVAYMEEGPR